MSLFKQSNTTILMGNIGEINQTNYCVVLQNAFIEKCRRNPLYSMRAFARFLHVDQSLLSKILRRERNPSIKFIKETAKLLRLNPVEIQTESVNSKSKNYHVLNSDIFCAISDWYHFAILELFKTTIPANPVSTSGRLGISIVQSTLAFDRLERLGFIARDDGKWKLCKTDNTWFNSKGTTPARVNLQKALFEKALVALDETSFENRDHSALTVACDRSQINQVKKKSQSSEDPWIRTFQKTNKGETFIN